MTFAFKFKNILIDFWKKYKNLILTVLLFSIIILNSGYTATYINQDTFAKTLIALISCIILFIIYLVLTDFNILVDKIKAKKPPISFLVLLAIGFGTIMTMLVSREINELNSYVSFGLIVFCGYLIAKLLTVENFIESYQKVMLFISIFCIFIQIFTLVSGTQFSIFPAFISNKHAAYDNYFFISFQGSNTTRMQGPFWEPGLFATFLLFALVFEVTFRQETRWHYFAIYLVALIFTMSTFGYLMLFFVVLFIACRKIKNFYVVVALIVLVYGAAIITFYKAETILPFLSKLMPGVFGKMVTPYGQIMLIDPSRLNSPWYNIQLWFKNPIFGNGISKANDLYASSFPGQSQTSTTTELLSKFGMFGLIPTICIIIGICKSDRIEVDEKFIFIFFYFILINKEPHTLILFDWVLMFLFIKEYIDKDKSGLLVDKPLDNSVISSFKKTDDKSVLKKNLAISYAIKGIALILGFFSYPIYQTYFSNNSTMGVWITVLSLMNIALTFDFGLGNGLKNKIIKPILEKDTEKQQKLISSTYISSIIISLIIFALASTIIWTINLNNFLGIGPEIISSKTLKISATLVIFSICAELTLKNICSLLQAKQKQALSNSFALFSTLLLVIFALIYKSTNQNTLLLAISIAYILTINIPLTIGTIFVFRKEFPGCHVRIKNINKDSLFSVATLGFGFFAIQLMLLCLTGTNEIIVSNIFGSSASVLYEDYFKVFNVFYSLFAIVTLPAWAMITKHKEENNIPGIKQVFKKCIIYCCIFTALGIILSVIFQPFINLWLGTNAIKVEIIVLLLVNANIIEMMLVSVLSVITNGLSIIKPQIIFYGIAAGIKIVLCVLLKLLPVENLKWYFVIIANVIAYIPLIVGLTLVVRKEFLKMKEKA